MRQNQSLKQESTYGEQLEMLIKKGEALHSQAIYELFASLFRRVFRKENLELSRRSQASMRERVSH